MHASFSYLSRSGGGSVASHAAYIAASIVKDKRMGQSWDYSKKAPEILATGILAPEGAPEWVYDPEKLWNRVEEFEDHIAHNRFKGHKDPLKNAKSLNARESFLSSCKTGYKLTFALPLEITNKDHLKELAHKIVKKCYVDHGLIAQYAIHDMKGNPHLHILAATRPLVKGTFSPIRHVIEKPQLKEKRAQLAEICNQFAQEKGYDYHIDARSYEDQGLKIIPTKHIGPNAHHRLQARSQNAQANEEIRQKNLEILLEHPEEIIKVVASQKAVFTQVDLAKEIFKRVGGDEKLYTVLKAKVDGIPIPSIAIIGKTLNDNPLYESKNIHFDKADYSKTIDRFTAQLLSHNNAIYLGRSIQGQAFYTSQEMKELESTLSQKIDILITRHGTSIKEKDKLNAIVKIQKQEGIIFSEEQRGAIDHFLLKEVITVLTGKAGTGKSTILKPVVEAYKSSGMTVMGVAFQGKVADQLAHDLHIEGFTLDQLKVKWDRLTQLEALIATKELKGQVLAKAKEEMKRLQDSRLTTKHVIILDEGSMVSGSLWKSLLHEVERSGAQLRIIQDNKQIKTLFGLDAARLVEDKVGAYEIKGVVRQRSPWMREASSKLNEHCIEEGLKPYYEQGHFDFRESDYGAKLSLIADYLEGVEKSPHQSHMALAQKNKDVVELNELIRGVLITQGKLGAEFVFGKEGHGILAVNQGSISHSPSPSQKSAYGKRFAIGDRVMFLSNDHKERYVKTLKGDESHSRGVKNGTLGVIESFDLKRQTVEVKLQDGRLVGFDSRSYDALTHGYAVTINKAQGATFDHSYGLFSSFNSNQLLIWLTRHKETFKGYVPKGIASDLKGMVSHVAQSDYKGLSSDYDLAENQKPYFNLVQQYWETAQEAGNLLTHIEAIKVQAEKEGKEISLSKQWTQYNKLIQIRNQRARDILKDWSQCSPFIHQTGVRRETLEVQAGLRKRLLSTVEEAALDKVEEYFKASNQARSLWKDIAKTHPGALYFHHPEYEAYTKIKAERNELAYEMSSFPMLYKSFFKVKEQDGSYVTYGGNLYKQRPQGFKAVLAHGDQYIEHRRYEAYENNLKFEERASYNQVLEYKNLHYQSVAAFSHLKEMRYTAVLPGIIETQQLKNQALAQSRDKLSYEIVSHYEHTQPFIEKLGLKEEILLKHAVFGEVRGMIESYKKSESITERTKLANDLVSFTLKENSDVDKPLYALLKEQNLTIQKLKFEQGWYKAHQAGKELSIKTIDELEKAYHDLSSYREDKKASTQWEILQIEKAGLTHSNESQFSNKLEHQRISLQGIKQAVNMYDREEVLTLLTRSHIEGIFARHIEGWVTTPKSTYHRNELRYGSKGGFVINRDTGIWYNFAAGAGGDIFKYVSQSQNITYGEAINSIGAEIHAPHLIQINWEERTRRQTELKLQAEHEEKIKTEKAQEKVQKLYDLSYPIQGTIAEKYLREHRKIETAELPQDLRFIADYKEYSTNQSYPALVAFARNTEGELRAAQVTCLDPIAANKADIEVKKRSLGSIKGSVVEIQSGDGPTYIAEGIETALSLKEVQVKGRIFVSLGLSNMANVGSHIKDKNEPLILCCDADEKYSSAWEAADRSLEKLQAQGFNTLRVKPEGNNGRDFNDVLQEEGINGVKRAFKDLPIFKENARQKAPHARPVEEQVASFGAGSSSNEKTQKEINQDKASLLETTTYDLNALELYLACEDTLKMLPLFTEAEGKEKELINSLNKDARKHAYTIWNNEELKLKAQEIGLEAEIKKQSHFYEQGIALEIADYDKDQALELPIKNKPLKNSIEQYILGKEKLEALPSFIAAKGEVKTQVLEIIKEVRLHAHTIWNNEELKLKAQELGLEVQVKKEAQIHERELQYNLQHKVSCKVKL